LSRKKYWAYFLFSLTICTTLYTGWIHSISFYSPTDISIDIDFFFTLRQPAILYSTIAFSLLLMLILTAHELGHYLTARRYGMDTTLPLFIPGPPHILSGTFGALIFIHSPFLDRRPLLEVGANGPIAGFLVSIPVLTLGISLSRVISISQMEGGITMGEPLLMKLLTFFIFPDLPANTDLLVHPLALAGWFGLIVTAMNLLPVGQLDGGHIIYAVFGNPAHWISLTVIVGLILLGAFAWPGWLLWAFLLTMIGYRHPPVPQETPLGPRRLYAAIVCLLIFILSFTPIPLQVQF